MKSLLCLLLLAGLCISTPAATATLTYTGDLMMDIGSVRLCADAVDNLGGPVAGETVWFRALDLWNTTRTPVLSVAQTDGAGRACLRVNLPPGAYEVQVFGADGGILAGVGSKPVAIAVVSPAELEGFSLAAILPVRGPVRTQNRNATFAFYYPYTAGVIIKPGAPFSYIYLPDARTEQFLLLDPDNPGGAVRIRMRDFRQVYAKYLTSPFTGIDLRFTGYCEFTIGDSKPVTRMCEIVFPFNDVYTVDLRFNVDVFDYARRSIYRVGGVPILPFM